MERLLWISLAGAAGTAARYLVTVWAAERLGGAFPAGTLLVNLAGSFAMAVLVEFAFHQAWPENLRLAVTTGFLGGFTTYSSFNHETTQMLAAGHGGTAGAYATATIAGALVAGWAGLAFARVWLRP